MQFAANCGKLATIEILTTYHMNVEGYDFKRMALYMNVIFLF